MTNLILMMCIQIGGLDCNLALSIATVESSLNPQSIGKSHGELGLFQLRPNFHKCASLDPVTNINCGLRYLKKIKSRHFKTHGNCFATFYNVGPNANIKYPCLHRYFKKIAKVYIRLSDKEYMRNIPKRDLSDYKLQDQYYLSEQSNVARAIIDTFLHLHEIEDIVGRFAPHSSRAGQLRGQVWVYLDGTKEIRHHFNKKLLWTNRGEQ